MRSKNQASLRKKQHGFAHVWYLCLFLTTISAALCISWVVSGRNTAIQRGEAIAQERKKFQGYSALTKQLGEQIAAKTNPPQTKQVEYCDRTNLKFEEGDLSWLSYHYLLYEGASKTQADFIDSKIKSILVMQTGFNAKKQVKRQQDYKIGGGIFNNKRCSYETRWYNKSPRLGSSYPFDRALMGAVVYVSCTDSALESYYEFIDY